MFNAIISSQIFFILITFNSIIYGHSLTTGQVSNRKKIIVMFEDLENTFELPENKVDQSYI